MAVRSGRGSDQNRGAPPPKKNPGGVPVGRDGLGILYSDDWLVAVEKPAGLLVNMPEKPEVTLQDLVRRKVPPSVLPDSVPPAAIHRLDRYTSGVVLFGRTTSALDRLSSMLREGRLNKTYLALAVGVLGEPEQTGTIDLALRETPDKRRRMTLWRTGQDGSIPARTEWRVLEVFHRGPGGLDTTLVELKPVTGRTHQLRVHLMGVGHPVVGDKVHGDKAANRAFRERMGLDRQFLHAWKVEFEHPFTGEGLELVSRLDSELMGLIRRLRG